MNATHPIDPAVWQQPATPWGAYFIAGAGIAVLLFYLWCLTVQVCAMEKRLKKLEGKNERSV